MQNCKVCGRLLERDEVSLNYKMINHEATEFECLNCLAVRYGVTRAYWEDRIAFLRRHGCVLFTEVPDTVPLRRD